MRLLLSLALLASTGLACAQQPAAPGRPAPEPAPLQTYAVLPDAPDVLLAQQSSSQQPTESADPAARGTARPGTPHAQPKRILGIMPNYRAVSAGVKPEPPTQKQAFKIATQQSFDYSAFVFVGLTSAIAEGEDSHPKLGKGIPGFWAYSWRGWVDKTDGNYWVVWILPTALHEDERYYALGRGRVIKRLGYAVSRVVVTPDYNGHTTVNGAELLGRGIAQAIGTTYYPSSDRTPGALATKYAYALMRDAATNAFREVWPDIGAHLGHHHE